VDQARAISETVRKLGMCAIEHTVV